MSAAKPCSSRYTVDDRTREVLKCDGNPADSEHGGRFRPHMATSYGARWTWTNAEADK